MSNAIALPTAGLMTREQAARYLGVRSQTLALWHSSQRYALPLVKVGRLCRYRQSDLDAWLESRTVRPAGDDDE